MAILKGHGVETSNIFTLYGEDEDAATHGVGCLLLHSPTFLDLFMKSLERDTNIHGKDMEKIKIELQRHRKEKKPSGRTDIEVGIEGDFCLIIEAKRWGPVVGKAQLKKYANLLTEKDGKVCFMTLTRSDKGDHKTIPGSFEKDIPVIHRSWLEIRNLVEQASEQTRKKRDNNDLENILLTHLYIHLENYAHYDKGEICVVPIRETRPTKVKNYTYLDVVTKGGGYFHPVGGRYPGRAPKHLGFRSNKGLRYVHKVKDDFIDTKFSSTGNGEFQEGELMWEENYNHVIYTLEKENLLKKYIGEKDSIPSEVKDSRGQQHWCDFEYLTPESTLLEAVEETRKKRERESKKRVEDAKEALRNLWKKTNQGKPPTPYPQTPNATPNPAPRGEGEGD